MRLTTDNMFNRRYKGGNDMDKEDEFDRFAKKNHFSNDDGDLGLRDSLAESVPRVTPPKEGTLGRDGTKGVKYAERIPFATHAEKAVLRKIGENEEQRAELEEARERLKELEMRDLKSKKQKEITFKRAMQDQQDEL